MDEIRLMDAQSDWNYVDNKLEPYLCGDDAEARELADDIEMFVHAPYSVEIE